MVNFLDPFSNFQQIFFTELQTLWKVGKMSIELLDLLLKLFGNLFSIDWNHLQTFDQLSTIKANIVQTVNKASKHYLNLV